LKPETFHEEVDFGPDVGREIWELEEIQAGLVEAERGDFASESEVAAVFERYTGEG
jgi:predicted transcriptional regulator